MNTISIANCHIELHRKNIKNIHLGVYPPYGHIRLAVPTETTDDVIRLFIVSKLSWIKKQQSRFLSQPRQSKREYLTGESHYFLGERYILRIFPSKNPHIKISLKKFLDIYIENPDSEIEKQTILQSWYQSEFEKILPEIIQKYSDLTGLVPEKYQIRKMKTRWWTAHSLSKKIALNSELIKKKKQYIEYVVLHELVHLEEPTHNEKFQSLMTKYMRNWRKIRQEMQADLLTC